MNENNFSNPVFQAIAVNKIVAIIRGANLPDIKQIARALWEGGIRLLEVTLNTPGALAMIEELSKQEDNDLLIGAGTVLNAREARDAVSAGARFIISPSYNSDVIAATKKSGALSIPGAFTATEIYEAYQAGGDIIKIFPASVGSGYIRDLRGPFPQIPLMPTGGINLQNIKEYLQAGAVAVGIGSALVDTKQTITPDYITELRSRAGKYSGAVSSIK